MTVSVEPAGEISARPGRPPAFVLGWLGVLAVIAASGVLYSTLPPSPDQWFLGYTGWMLTKGAVPYQGFADGNWPACHWLHAISILLLGNTPRTWRVFDFVIMLIGTSFASHTARSLWGWRAGAWLLVLYPPLYVVTGYWFAGERDIVGAHFLFVALWFYWTGLSKQQAAWQVGTGMLLALAALVKPTLSLFGPFLALHCLLAGRSVVHSLRMRSAQIAIAGASSILGLAAGFALLRLQGTPLDAFWDLAVRSIVIRYGNDSMTLVELLESGLHDALTSWHWIFGGAAIALVANLARREPDGLARNLLFPTLWVTGLASYLLQVQGFRYTLGVPYAATVPILCSGLGLITVRHVRTRGWRSALFAALVLAPVLGTAKKWSSEFESSIRWLAGRISADVHYSRFPAGDGISAAEAMALAARLKRTVPETGTILVWGRANVINFLAERPQPTRFHHNVVITRRYLPDDLAARWNALFCEEVQARKPEFCLVNQQELQGPMPQPGSIVFLKEYLERNYLLVSSVGDGGLFRRKQLGDRAATSSPCIPVQGQRP
jgi:hypothetical protein